MGRQREMRQAAPARTAQDPHLGAIRSSSIWKLAEAFRRKWHGTYSGNRWVKITTSDKAKLCDASVNRPPHDADGICLNAHDRPAGRQWQQKRPAEGRAPGRTR